jgi:predicted metal-dependent hydrolase
MIDYTHKTHPRSRSIKIKVESSGEVVVVTPKQVSKKVIESFVIEQSVWIQKHLNLINKKKEFSETATTIAIFGKKYIKKEVTNDTQKAGAAIKGNTLLINQPSYIQKVKSTKYIERFLKNSAEKYIVPRTHQLAKKMSISFGKITLKQQKTRWGSCSSEGNLNFNWRLVHAPTKIIDYVIIHELAHRIHMNHSAAFWNLVAQYDPSHREHRGWLKRNGMSVG